MTIQYSVHHLTLLCRAALPWLTCGGVVAVTPTALWAVPFCEPSVSCLYKHICRVYIYIYIYIDFCDMYIAILLKNCLQVNTFLQKDYTTWKIYIFKKTSIFLIQITNILNITFSCRIVIVFHGGWPKPSKIFWKIIFKIIISHRDSIPWQLTQIIKNNLRTEILFANKLCFYNSIKINKSASLTKKI